MIHKYIKNVVTLNLDTEKCTGCGMCIQVCPHGVFQFKGKKPVIRDKDRCMECGACARNCPFEAISVKAGVGCAIAALNSKSSDCGTECSC